MCTDSFHASVFSFIFEVPLAIFDREGQHSNMGGRLTNLAEKFGLQRCFAKNDTIPDDVWNADYSFGKEILKDERKKVDKFLNKVFLYQCRFCEEWYRLKFVLLIGLRGNNEQNTEGF